MTASRSFSPPYSETSSGLFSSTQGSGFSHFFPMISFHGGHCLLRWCPLTRWWCGVSIAACLQHGPWTAPPAHPLDSPSTINRMMTNTAHVPEPSHTSRESHIWGVPGTECHHVDGRTTQIGTCLRAMCHPENGPLSLSHTFRC